MKTLQDFNINADIKPKFFFFKNELGQMFEQNWQS